MRALTLGLLVEPNDCFHNGRGGLLIADVADWRIRRLDLKTGPNGLTPRRSPRH